VILISSPMLAFVSKALFFFLGLFSTFPAPSSPSVAVPLIEAIIDLSRTYPSPRSRLYGPEVSVLSTGSIYPARVRSLPHTPAVFRFHGTNSPGHLSHAPMVLPFIAYRLVEMSPSNARVDFFCVVQLGSRMYVTLVLILRVSLPICVCSVSFADPLLLLGWGVSFRIRCPPRRSSPVLAPLIVILLPIDFRR